MKRITSFLLICSFFIFTAQVSAQTCTPIYGGGVTDETTCDKQTAVPTSTPKPFPTTKPLPTTKPQPTQPKQPGTTKGGLPVLSPAPAKTTPSTGPETLALVALAPAAALGFYLRKKV